MDVHPAKTSADINTFISNEKKACEKFFFTTKIGAELYPRADGQSKLNTVNRTTIDPEQCTNLAQNGGAEAIQGLIEVILYLLTCAHAPDNCNNCVICANALAILQHKFKIVDEFLPYMGKEKPAPCMEEEKRVSDGNNDENSTDKPEKSKKEDKSLRRPRSCETEDSRASRTRDRSPPRYKAQDVNRKST